MLRLPGILMHSMKAMLLETWSMRYKLQTRFIPTDMKTWKQIGTINVANIWFSAAAARLRMLLASSIDLPCCGTRDSIR